LNCSFEDVQGVLQAKHVKDSGMLAAWEDKTPQRHRDKEFSKEISAGRSQNSIE
jgi:hypothetical protein